MRNASIVLSDILVASEGRVVVLSGAGISASSGIPVYRNDEGVRINTSPIQHHEFIQRESVRKRYWSRSILGWPVFRETKPTKAHLAVKQLQEEGYLGHVITQNVDRLHQKGGSKRCLDLHGRLDRTLCLSCGDLETRDKLQARLEKHNPEYKALEKSIVTTKPDGDAEPHRDSQGFVVPSCARCGDGNLMPDLIFFGGCVPKPRVAQAKELVSQADTLLCLGSSLQIMSGFRFCRQAKELGKQLVVVSKGKTRADEMADIKLEADLDALLPQVVSNICSKALKL